MYLYKIKGDARYRPHDFVSYVACDRNDKVVSVHHPKSVRDLMGYVDIEDALDIQVCAPTKYTLSDNLYAIGEYLIINERFMQMLEDLSVSAMRSKPVRVLGEGNILRANYTLAYAGEAFDPIDYDKSGLDILEGRHASKYDVADEYVFDELRLPDTELFYVHGEQVCCREWVATERFKYEVESRGLTGCRFEPIAVDPRGSVASKLP